MDKLHGISPVKGVYVGVRSFKRQLDACKRYRDFRHVNTGVYQNGISIEQYRATKLAINVSMGRRKFNIQLIHIEQRVPRAIAPGG